MFRNIQHLLGRVEIRVLVLLVCGSLLISFALAVAQLTKIPSSEPSNVVSSWDDLTKKYLSFREDNYALVVPGWFLVYGQIEAILNEYGLEELQKDPEWYWTFDGGTFVFGDDSPLARQVASGTHIVIYEDSANEELLVLSEPEKEGGEYQEEIVCKAPAYPEQEKGTDYESYLYNELSKRRIAWKVVLKSRSAVEKEAAEEQELLTEEGEGGELLLRMTMEEGSNHLWVSIQGPAQGLSNMEIAAHIPDGFTNRIEIFTCTNLMDAWWTLAATNLSTEGTNTVYWIHDEPEELETFFYTAGNADIDTDEDGLTDARERFLYHTDPTNPDTDGDGASDGDEVDAQTDPLNNPGDFDQDGLSDDLEVVLGTDPDEPDTDEDWVSDGYEVEKETDPLDIEDYPWLSLVINDGAAYAPSTTLEVSVPGLVADTLILSESPAMDNSTTGACVETVSYVLAHDTNGTRFVSAVAVRDGVTTGFTGSSSITLDTVPPSLQVELPTNGFVTSARWIDVEGVVTDAVGNVGVKVDGDWADGIVRGAFWERRHPLNEGSNQLEVTAWDSAGHVVTQSLQVVQDLSQDTNAPTFSLGLPSDFWVDDGVTNWSQGTTTLGDDGTLQFDGVIDDETAEASAWIERDGTTSGPFYVATGLATQMCGRIALPHGTNQLTVRAIDAAGNTSTAAWTVIRNTGCLFRISSPVPDCVINDWSVQVTCVASPWFSNAEVTVNGNAAVLTACTTTAVFQTTIPVPLQQGVTRLTARAVVNGRTYFTDSAVVAYEVTRWACIERLQLAERNYFEGPAARAGAWEYESTWECVPQLRVDWSEWTYWEMDGWGNREDYEGSSPAEWKEKRGPPAATRSGHVASGSHSIEFDISSAYAYEGFVYLKRVSFATNRETIVLQLSGFDYGRETSATMNLSEVTYRGHGGFWLGSNAAFLVNMKSGVETVISPDDFDVPAFSYTTADGGFFSSSGKWLEFNSVTTSVLKVELKATHPVNPGPTGSAAKYNNTPTNGSADNLFSTWDNEQFKVNVKLDPSNITSSLPAGFIHWTVAGFSIPDNTTDYTFTWSATGIKEITVEFPSCGITKTIYVEVPDVGPISQATATLLLPPPVALLIAEYADESLDYCNTNFPAGPQRDAYRHCYWNSLCVSHGDITRDQTLMLTTAHEYTNKEDEQQAFNSSMDLRNNMFGAYIEHTLIDGEPNRNTIRSDITTAYVVGNLYIWEGGGTQESSEGITVKSDGSKIFPVP